MIRLITQTHETDCPIMVSVSPLPPNATQNINFRPEHTAEARKRVGEDCACVVLSPPLPPNRKVHGQSRGLAKLGGGRQVELASYH
ncbi:hypothetical protein CDAR_207371 [Caerostris darwini]|uniref:Uncharacterized protein n=1 Tax=Caerostris darwini TaxID=1538125 RepID=A0AAV4VGJ9_9ARAC|nr:hypothetical protein CDAR_207371 [Caerostris darwini]